VDYVAGSAAAHSAADQFAALAKAAPGGQLPRQTDPAAARLLDAVFNTGATPVSPPPSDQIGAVEAWRAAVTRTGYAYLLAGSSADASADDPAVADPASPAGQAISTQIDRNLMAYAPEIGRYIDAQASLMGTEAEMSLATATDPAQQGSLRRSVALTTGALIDTVAESGPSVEWKRARVAALVALAPHAAKLLAPNVREDLQSIAMSAEAGSDPDAGLRAEFEQFQTLIGAGLPAPG
jgi:hypothetical protein